MGVYLVGLPTPGAIWGGGGAWGSTVWGAAPASTELLLPPGLTLKDNSFAQRSKANERVFADGGFSYGGEVEDRDAVVSGLVKSATRAEQLELLNDLRYQCQVATKLRLNAGSYLNLTRLKGFDEDPEPLFDRAVSRLRIAWQCDDPYWYADDPVELTFELAGNTVISVDALAGQQKTARGQHPVITITAPEGGVVDSVLLRNDSDGGLQLRYSDPGLVDGAAAVLDCARGVATRAGENTVRYLEGEWLRLLNQLNSLTYEGPACTLKFYWRPRWL